MSPTNLTACQNSVPRRRSKSRRVIILAGLILLHHSTRVMVTRKIRSTLQHRCMRHHLQRTSQAGWRSTRTCGSSTRTGTFGRASAYCPTPVWAQSRKRAPSRSLLLLKSVTLREDKMRGLSQALNMMIKRVWTALNMSRHWFIADLSPTRGQGVNNPR